MQSPKKPRIGIVHSLAGLRRIGDFQRHRSNPNHPAASLRQRHALHEQVGAPHCPWQHNLTVFRRLRRQVPQRGLPLLERQDGYLAQLELGALVVTFETRLARDPPPRQYLHRFKTLRTSSNSDEATSFSHHSIKPLSNNRNTNKEGVSIKRHQNIQRQTETDDDGVIDKRGALRTAARIAASFQRNPVVDGIREK